MITIWPYRRGRRVPPSARTFRRVLALVDAQAVATAFGTWLKGQLPAGLADAAALVVALDGKTVRGVRTKDSKAPHLLAAMICGARAVIAGRPGVGDQAIEAAEPVQRLPHGLTVRLGSGDRVGCRAGAGAAG